jgi:hypothetical protein
MSSHTVLVAEDDILIRLMLVDALIEEGYCVVQTGSVPGAVAAIDRNPLFDDDDRCRHAGVPNGPRFGCHGFERRASDGHHRPIRSHFDGTANAYGDDSSAIWIPASV